MKWSASASYCAISLLFQYAVMEQSFRDCYPYEIYSSMKKFKDLWLRKGLDSYSLFVELPINAFYEYCFDSSIKQQNHSRFDDLKELSKNCKLPLLHQDSADHQYSDDLSNICTKMDEHDKYNLRRVKAGLRSLNLNECTRQLKHRPLSEASLSAFEYVRRLDQLNRCVLTILRGASLDLEAYEMITRSHLFEADLAVACKLRIVPFPVSAAKFTSTFQLDRALHPTEAPVPATSRLWFHVMMSVAGVALFTCCGSFCKYVLTEDSVANGERDEGQSAAPQQATSGIPSVPDDSQSPPIFASVLHPFHPDDSARVPFLPSDYPIGQIAPPMVNELREENLDNPPSYESVMAKERSGSSHFRTERDVY